MAEEHSGYIVLRLSPELFLPLLLKQGKDLRALAQEAGARDLLQVLKDYGDCTVELMITSVEPEKLLALEEAARSHGFADLPSLTSYWRLDARKINDVATLLHRLASAEGVQRAYQELRHLDSAVNPNNDPFSNLELHLDSAPIGIDARWAWTLPNGSGESVTFIDLEQGWTLRHEDFPQIFPLPGVRQDINPGHEPHGTAVLGIVAAADNTKGVIGIAPHTAHVSVASHYRASDGTGGLVADAIVAVLASGAVTPGDVLLLEVQHGNNGPIELDEVVFAAVSMATSLGIVVVEAAGNGNTDLDSSPALNRQNRATFKDSGAILVGAGLSALDAAGTGHERWVIATPGPGSNFGSRIDCYAYGDNVVTTGPTFNGACALGAGTQPHNQYRCDFGGTSAAAAIVAGAAVVVQGLYRRLTALSLTSAQMRQALRANGTPQGATVAGHIGRMPDLKAIATALARRPPSAPTNIRIPH